MPNPTVADVAIIGGGPAGCAAAISLALSGLRVALLERTSYGPARVGETLPPAVQPLLHQLGVWGRFLADEHASAPGLVVQWGGGPPHETDHIFDPYGCGWNLDRVRFDRSLYEACRELEGVIAFSGVTRLACERRPDGAGDAWLLSFTTEPAGSGASAARGAGVSLLSAHFVIGATGRAGPPFAPRGSTRVAVDNLVGLVGLLPPHLAHEGGAAEDPRIWIEPVRDGWWYSAPLPGGSLVATYMTDADLMRAQGGPSAAWQFALKQAPRLRSRLRAGADVTEMNRQPEGIRVVSAGSYCRRRLANENYLLVGDAACAWDPLSGQGVFRALTEGREAARAVDAYVGGRHRGALAEYEGRVLNNFNTYLRERHETYLGETRWPSSLFWLRRHAVPGADNSRSRCVNEGLVCESRHGD